MQPTLFGTNQHGVPHQLKHLLLSERLRHQLDQALADQSCVILQGTSCSAKTFILHVWADKINALSSQTQLQWVDFHDQRFQPLAMDMISNPELSHIGLDHLDEWAVLQTSSGIERLVAVYQQSSATQWVMACQQADLAKKLATAITEAVVVALPCLEAVSQWGQALQRMAPFYGFALSVKQAHFLATTVLTDIGQVQMVCESIANVLDHPQHLTDDWLASLFGRSHL